MSKKWLIGLDPGHGNPDQSNRGPTGYVEAHGVLDIALACEKELNRHGVECVLTRRDNSYNEDNLSANLHKRVGVFHRAKADMSVSIHTNAPGSKSDWDKVRGVMVIHSYAPMGNVGRELALKIVDEFVALGVPKWGKDGTWTRTYKKKDRTYDYYGMVRMPNMPAVIVECEFHTHPVGEQLLKDSGWRKKFGRAIARGILKQIGISIILPMPEEPEKPRKEEIKRAIELLDEAKGILSKLI